jgi:hypothetical protein
MPTCRERAERLLGGLGRGGYGSSLEQRGQGGGQDEDGHEAEAGSSTVNKTSSRVKRWSRERGQRGLGLQPRQEAAIRFERERAFDELDWHSRQSNATRLSQGQQEAPSQ